VSFLPTFIFSGGLSLFPQMQNAGAPRPDMGPLRSARTCWDLREMVFRAYGSSAQTENLRAIF
jgi:hypothetical protein